jgi:uroporphyrin-III C-methyltransferase/precorrin-2 dehydrogenase/sirohydrochlorin ferrochelatase
LKDGSIDLNWPALAQPNQTVVFYMGLHGAPTLCSELIKHGMPPSTPVALVQKGTTPEQKTIIASLETLEDAVKHHELKPPTLIIVGEVVRMKEKLDWFNPEVPQGQGIKSGRW